MAVMANLVNEMLTVSEGNGGALEYSEHYGNQALASAIRDVVNLLPDEILYKSALMATATTGYEDCRIIRVVRPNDDGHDITCRALTYDEGVRAGDSNSIYHISTDSDLNPGYYFNHIAAIGSVAADSHKGGSTPGDYISQKVIDMVVLPNATGLKVYYVPYFKSTNAGGFIQYDLSGEADDMLGIPNTAFYAIIIKTSLNIIARLFTNAVQGEEDSEMLTMLQTQATNLQGLYQVEMNNLGVNMNTGQEGS